MRIAIPIVVALAILGPGEAYHCATWSTAGPEVNALGLYYVDYDPCPMDCMDSVWIYEESNGIPGLQRGDEIRDNTCHNMIRADTIIF